MKKKYLFSIVFLFFGLNQINFAQNSTAFKGHLKSINCIEISNDGEILITASDDKTIRLWNANDGKRICTLKGHEQGVTCLAISQNTQYLLSGSKDGSIKLWDILQQKEIRTFKGHNAEVKSIVFFDNSENFISGDVNGTLQYWKTNKSKSLETIEAHKNSINQIVISPDLKYFLTASSDNSIKIWNKNSLKVYRNYSIDNQLINSLAFTSDSRNFYSAASDGTVKIWRINSSKHLNTIEIHQLAINSIQLSSDDRYLFTASDDGTIKTTDLISHETIFTYHSPYFDELKSLKLSPNQKFLFFTNSQNIPQKINVQTEKKIANDYNSNTWVVIVGITEYQYRQPSKYSGNDALRIYGFYKSPQGGALNEQKIKVLTNHQADDKSILRAIDETFSQATDSDIVIFYFSGHGENEGLVPYNANDFNKNLSYEILIHAIEKSKAKHKICFIDACYSGSLSDANYFTKKQVEKYSESKNFAFLLSSKAEEQALGYRNLNQGIFSYFLLEGLNGNANLNSDNCINITELFNYVEYKVKNYTANNQNPLLIGNFDENLRVSFIFNTEN